MYRFLCVCLVAVPLLASETLFPGAEKVDARLMQKLEADVLNKQATSYRIQVTLKSPKAKAAYRFQTAVQRGAVTRDVIAVQDRVLQRVGQTSMSVLNRYRLVFGFSARADVHAIAALAAEQDVLDIGEMPVYRKRQTSDRPGDREAFPLVNMDAVHDRGYTGSGITIAILDDGIDVSHPAFAGKIVGGYDFGDNDDDFNWDGTACEDQTHGTAVAGVAAGKGGNVWGTAPDARIAFFKLGSREDCEGLIGDVAAAVDRAVQEKDNWGIRVINMSFGEQDFFDDTQSCVDAMNPVERQAYSAADAAGIIMFASAGNEASCNGIIIPSCVPEVISVGSVYDADIGGDANCYAVATCATSTSVECPDEAPHFAETTTEADKVALYSNSGSLLDILAPADFSLSAQAGGGETTMFNGTSSASPFAAGVGAVMIAAAGGEATRENVLGWLRDHGVDRTDEKNNLTRPRVDAEASLNAVLGNDGGGTTTPTGTVAERWIAHLTPTANFITSIQVTNATSSDQSFSFQAYNTDGSAAGTAANTVSAGDTRTYAVTQLFGGDISHFRILEGEVVVSVSYQAASGGSPAVVAERGTHGAWWRTFPGNDDVVTDGIAVVNLGDAATDIVITQKEPGGVEGTSQTVISGLGAKAKGLYLFSGFTPDSDSFFDITASQPIAIMALRFEKPSSTFLWENATLLMSGN